MRASYWEMCPFILKPLAAFSVHPPCARAGVTCLSDTAVPAAERESVYRKLLDMMLAEKAFPSARKFGVSGPGGVLG